MEKIISSINNNKLYISVVIAVIGIILYEIIKRTINRILEKDKTRNKLDKKGRTVVKLFTNIIKYVIITIVGVLILQVYGVNVITDDYFALGDVVRIDDIEGKVVYLGVRTTKIKDTANGNILVLANRNISKVIKVSDEIYMEIPLSYEDDTDKIVKILNKALESVRKHENVIEADYIGIDKFADSSINYKLKILCKPENKFAVRRFVNGTIKKELDKNEISIPYPQLTIHKGE